MGQITSNVHQLDAQRAQRLGIDIFITWFQIEIYFSHSTKDAGDGEDYVEMIWWADHVSNTHEERFHDFLSLVSYRVV